MSLDPPTDAFKPAAAFSIVLLAVVALLGLVAIVAAQPQSAPGSVQVIPGGTEPPISGPIGGDLSMRDCMKVEVGAPYDRDIGCVYRFKDWCQQPAHSQGDRLSACGGLGARCTQRLDHLCDQPWGDL